MASTVTKWILVLFLAVLFAGAGASRIGGGGTTTSPPKTDSAAYRPDRYDQDHNDHHHHGHDGDHDAVAASSGGRTLLASDADTASGSGGCTHRHDGQRCSICNGPHDKPAADGTANVPSNKIAT
ncbi:hypothetical protein ABZP36_006526 [Zizania latifolia]